MKPLFIPCTFDGLPRNSGSRMIRCEWVAKYWEGAEVYDGTQRLTDFSLFVFQKAYMSEQSRSLIAQLADYRDRGAGIALAFDLCDPDFMDERHRTALLDVLPVFDFATAPTKPLVGWLEQWLPAYVVPDGVDLDAITSQREFVATKTPSIVWMGYEGNTGALNEIAATMTAVGVTGDIVSVKSPIPFDKYLEQLVEYDILLNPRPDRPPYLYKSDNKTLIAWAAGVAVARDGDELRMLLAPVYRSVQIESGKEYVENGHGNIRHSVAEWQNIASPWCNIT